MYNKIVLRENEFLKEKYYFIEHKSGLRIFVFPKKLTTSFAMFGTQYGSIDNTFKLENWDEYKSVPDGIAHFLEHKMFENEDGSDTFSLFAKTGASSNAYTSFEVTNYLFSCTENFYESLEILLKFVTSPYFTEETVKKELGIIGQEIRMYDDNPNMRLFMGAIENMFSSHPVRIDLGGTVESISKITPEHLYLCYNTFYNLNNMALCVSGDIQLEEVLKVADRILKPAPQITLDRYFPREEPCVYKKYGECSLQVSKPLFNIGIKDVEISSDPVERMKKACAVDILLSVVLGDTGKFYNELYDEGLITADFSFEYVHNKYFSFASVSGESKDPRELYSRFIDTVRAFKSSGISEADFERTKIAKYSELIKSFDSTEEISSILMSHAFEDSDIFDYFDVVKNISIDDVNSVIDKIFNEDAFTLFVVNPLN